LVFLTYRIVNEGEIGISMNNGKPELITPGRHFLLSPFNLYQDTFSMRTDLIKCGPITIVRVNQGNIGIGVNGPKIELLMPGLHIRNDGMFDFIKSYSLLEDLIEYGSVKIFTIPSGFVRICYVNGKVRIFPEGRYAVNFPTFKIDKPINIQQQNLPFNKHRVMLNGGIVTIVEGLLTYRIIHVEQMVNISNFPYLITLD